MAKLVSNVYGDALFQAAVEQKKVDAYLSDVKHVQNLLQKDPQLTQLLAHPRIVREEKKQVLEKIFKGNIADEITGLLLLLVEKNHATEILSVLTYFVDSVKEYKHIGTAYVKTAVELNNVQKKDIEQKLLDTTDYTTFEMHYDVEPSLIGGMVIRIKDRVVDSSIRTKLYDLSRELSKIQLKAGEITP
ncbi:MAG: ATP synthase F1 subunit delta [Lachnospiraceae bacterium]